MIIRIQSEDGNRRIDVNPSDSTAALFDKANSVFGLGNYDFVLHKTRDKTNEIYLSNQKTLKSYKLCHGDMVYLFQNSSKANNSNNSLSASSPSLNNESLQKSNSCDTEMMAVASTSSTSSAVSSRRASTVSEPSSALKQIASTIKSDVVEDEVDVLLDKMDGTVQRKRNPTSCRHLGNSRCIHCTPLDPWDESILKDNNIKHLSFHAYLRKLISGVDKGKFTYLEAVNCRIKSGCPSHLPWPQGICSKCQPSAVTLNRQTFRHVDNVTFENAAVAERFLEYWRVTGHQRIGMLYGRHLPHLDVPLGIKATVAAIYEPPQDGSKDHVRLLPDPNEDVVKEVAAGLGLRCVGWIFTDLVPLDASAGTVRYLRHLDTFFLSAHEVVTAAHLQNKHPNPCKLAPTGDFGSKFATVIVTGDKENQVHMEGYQVSNQCQSLVRDNCLVPTKDAPELAYIRESSSEQYVPDVYFKEKDQYGNDAVRLGRPLPVEYLLLDCPVSTPNEPVYTFGRNAKPFPIEHRFLEGHLQDFSALTIYLKNFDCDSQFLEAMTDFHLLVFLATMEMLPLKECLAPLLASVRTGDRAAAQCWKSSEQWATVEQLVLASDTRPHTPPPSLAPSGDAPPTQRANSEGPGNGFGGLMSANGSGSAAVAASWTCNHCTYINEGVSENCDMCHLPR